MMPILRPIRHATTPETGYLTEQRIFAEMQTVSRECKRTADRARWRARLRDALRGVAEVRAWRAIWER